MSEIVTPFDIQRMFFGEQPFGFYAEIIVRTLIIYAYALVLLRWVGSRTVGQLSVIEFLLVIALGSAVGDPLFYPDVPLFHAMLVITVIVLANKGLDLLVARNRKVERLLDGKPVEIIRNGVICQEAIQQTDLGRSELFEQLRAKSVRHLGELESAFIEAGGHISVYPHRDKSQVSPGLPVFPPWEVRPPDLFKAGEVMGKSAALACAQCGTPHKAKAKEKLPPCAHCHHGEWARTTTG